MHLPKKPVSYMLFFSGLILLLILAMQPLEIYEFHKYIAILFPSGMIGVEQRDLLILIQVIMLFVIIPVYLLTFYFSWHYRVDNTKATYDPDLVDHKLAEYIWWGIPLVFTVIICVITYFKTYQLDPYRPIESDKKPLTVQVVAMDWKWLFIYPEEQIASLNFLQIPAETPIHFEITSDAPMNSFWIPDLGGQIYAMPTMRTELHLIANKTGDFRGSSANLSGVGFAGMHFITRASTQEEFEQWIASAKQSEEGLNFEKYQKLAAPSENNPAEQFHLEESDLFEQIMMKFMHPKRV